MNVVNYHFISRFPCKIAVILTCNYYGSQSTYYKTNILNAIHYLFLFKVTYIMIDHICLLYFRKAMLHLSLRYLI